MKTYLAGPINGCSDFEARSWRAEAAWLLGDVVDPMVRDYRGAEALNTRELVEEDKTDILGCDAVLAFCPKPSVGTSMEVLFAWERGITVVAVVPTGPVSPWLRYHSDAVVDSVREAVQALSERTTFRSLRSQTPSWR